MWRHDRPWKSQKQYFWIFWDNEMLCIFNMFFILICQVIFDNTIAEIHVCILCHERQLLTFMLKPQLWKIEVWLDKDYWRFALHSHSTHCVVPSLSKWTVLHSGLNICRCWMFAGWGVVVGASQKASCMQHAGDAQRHNSARAASA